MKIITSIATLLLLLNDTLIYHEVVIYPQYCHVLHLRSTISTFPNTLKKLGRGGRTYEVWADGWAEGKTKGFIKTKSLEGGFFGIVERAL